MITKSVNIYQIKEKKPRNRERVMVSQGVLTFIQLFDEYNNSWCDYSGDIFEYDVDPDDYWYSIPTIDDVDENKVVKPPHRPTEVHPPLEGDTMTRDEWENLLAKLAFSAPKGGKYETQ